MDVDRMTEAQRSVRDARVRLTSAKLRAAGLVTEAERDLRRAEALVVELSLRDPVARVAAFFVEAADAVDELGNWSTQVTNEFRSFASFLGLDTEEEDVELAQRLLASMQRAVAG